MKKIIRFVERNKRKLKTLNGALDDKLVANPKFYPGLYNTRYKRIFYYVVCDVDISKIMVNLKSIGLVNIESSPHYKFAKAYALQNRIDPEYKSYLLQNYKEENSDEAVTEFIKTYNFVVGNPDEQFLLVRFMEKEKEFVELVDGLHRLAILKLIGAKVVRCALI